MTMLPRIGNAQSQLNKRRQQELESRRQATIILQPSEVAGKLSPARMLTTTLGGQVRPITAADLAEFRKSVAALGDKARAGITAQEALGLSRPADIARAKEEIRFSLPSRLQAGKVHLVTNSGPLSKVTRHHVNIEFASYAAALARPGTPAQAAQWLVKEGAMRFECDCEHFRYFLRFVATAGGWVAGRAEHGLPKLKNPHLDGALCKHLGRVMTDVQSSIGLRQRIAQMIEADRVRIDKPNSKAKPKAIFVSQADAERMLPKNVRRIVLPAQRGASMPVAASQADLAAALAAFSGLADANSLAISRGLRALLTSQTQGATP